MGIEHQKLKCLFICQDCSLSFNHSGASSRRMMDFLALLNLNVEIYFVRFISPVKKIELTLFEENADSEIRLIRDKTKLWVELDYKLQRRPKKELLKIHRLLFGNTSHYLFSNVRDYSIQIEKLIDENEIDLVWTSSTFSALVVSDLKKTFKWVNYIGDWRYRLRLIRNRKKNLSYYSRLKEYFFSRLDKKLDLDTIRKCDFVETSSVKQEMEIRKMGIENILAIPQFYSEIGNINFDFISNENPKIIHLGSLETTSNKIGLLDYINCVHPVISNEIEDYKLTIIGDVNNSSKELTQLIEKDNVNCLGHVIDLEKVIKPLDIAIIPYNKNTGMRTKIALFHSLGMAVISFRKPVEGMKEIVDGQNAILVDDFESFIRELKRLFFSIESRKKLAICGLKTFNETNSLKSQLHHYKYIFEKIGFTSL